MCSMVKVFVRVLTRRLGRFAEDRILTEAQGGFRSGKICSDQWLVLRGVCKVQKREKKNSYLAFLDISKAFDSVWRGGYGVEDKFVRVCEGPIQWGEDQGGVEGREIQVVWSRKGA